MCCLFQITDWMAQIQKNHSDVVTIMDYGKTYEMKTISLLKVKKQKTNVYYIWIDVNYSYRNPVICPSDWGEHWSQKESHLDGLWYPRQGMDCSSLLPVLCQTGDKDHALVKIIKGKRKKKRPIFYVLPNVFACFALGLIRSWMLTELRPKCRR